MRITDLFLSAVVSTWQIPPPPLQIAFDSVAKVIRGRSILDDASLYLNAGEVVSEVTDIIIKFLKSM